MASALPSLDFAADRTEIVDEGVTGFVVDDVDAAVKVLPARAGLAASAVGSRFEQRFQVERMSQNYARPDRTGEAADLFGSMP